jgi:hypothetical protein
MSLKTAEQVLNEMLGTQGLTLDQALAIVLEAAKDSNTITVREGQSVQAANTASDYVIVCPGTYTEANGTITLRANTRVVPEIPNTVIFDCDVVIEAGAVLGYGIQVTGTVSGAGIALTDPATSPLWFGDGSDGSFTMIYNGVNLSEQRSYLDFLIISNLTCYTNGIPLICSGKLLIDGTLSDYSGKNGNNGEAGVGSGAIGGLGGASLAKTSSLSCLWYHWKNGNTTAFGAGGSGGKSGAAATVGSSPQNYFGYTVFPIGGSTGGGGLGGGNGAAGGMAYCGTQFYPLTHLLKGAIGLWSADGGWRYIYGGVNGCGGGGGGRVFDGDSIYYNGGGGGGGGLGGGIITIYANELEIGASGMIDASGGNGGNGGDGVSTYGGGGGGGSAGGGGVVVILCNKLTCADDISNHINVAGGIGGSGGSLTNPTESRRGASGANGYDGRWMVVELSTGRIWHG